MKLRTKTDRGVYDQKITFYGYERTVVSRKPPRLDADGDVVDEDDESDPDLTPADDDAYGEVKIESTSCGQFVNAALLIT